MKYYSDTCPECIRRNNLNKKRIKKYLDRKRLDPEWVLKTRTYWRLQRRKQRAKKHARAHSGNVG